MASLFFVPDGGLLGLDVEAFAALNLGVLLFHDQMQLVIADRGIGFAGRIAEDVLFGQAESAEFEKKSRGRKADPSAPWPARQTAARRKKPATPVGMTRCGVGRKKEKA